MSSFQGDLENVLGVGVYKKLGEQVAGGKISVSKAEAFAFRLNSSVGGNFKNRRVTPNFRYDKEAFLQIPDDWYETDPESKRKKLGVEILRILKALDLVAVATDLENVMPRPTGTLLKEKKGKGKRKR